MDGFWRLSNVRPIGFAGPQRIPITEIEAYCRLRQFSYDRVQDFLFYVERLDEKYMGFVKDSQEKEAQKTGNKPSSSKQRTNALGNPHSGQWTINRST